MCWNQSSETPVTTTIVSVAGCLGYDVLVKKSFVEHGYVLFQLLVV